MIICILLCADQDCNHSYIRHSTYKFYHLYFLNRYSFLLFLLSEFWIKLTLTRGRITDVSFSFLFLRLEWSRLWSSKIIWGEDETVLCARCGRVFAVYRAIRLRDLLLRGKCVPKRRKTRRHERKPREKGTEEESGEETRWRTEEGKGTNAVGGSWRRNDYRPRTHSLPAIISSTNATKSIESSLRKISSTCRSSARD